MNKKKDPLLTQSLITQTATKSYRKKENKKSEIQLSLK
jgi:hypothetical protein